MSRWLDHADILADYLRQTIPCCTSSTLTGHAVEVMVDRKLDLASTVAQVAAKARGAAIVILFTGARKPDRKSKVLTSGAGYTIFVMTRPLFTDGKVTCDDLTEAVATALHGWEPTDGKSPVSQRLEVLSIDLAPHKSLMIYEISAEILRLKH